MNLNRTPGRMIAVVLFLSLLVCAPAFGITGSRPYQALIPTINKLLQKQGSARRLAKNAAYTDVVNTLMTLTAGPGLPPGQVAVPAAQLKQLLAQIPAVGATIGAKIQTPTTLPAAIQAMAGLQKAIPIRILAAAKAGHPALSANILADMIKNTNAISTTVHAPNLPATATIDQVSTTLGTLPGKIAGLKPSPAPTPGGLGAGQVAVLAADLTATLAAVHAVQTAVAGKPGGAPAPAAAPATLQIATAALNAGARAIGTFRVLTATQTPVETADIDLVRQRTRAIGLAIGGGAVVAEPANIPATAVAMATIEGAIPGRVLTATQTAVENADILAVGGRIQTIGAAVGGGAVLARAPATINAAAGDLQTISGVLTPAMAATGGRIHDIGALIGGVAVVPAPATVSAAAVDLQTILREMPPRVLTATQTAVENAVIADAAGRTNDVVAALGGKGAVTPALAANASLADTIAKLGNIAGLIPPLNVLSAAQEGLLTGGVRGIQMAIADRGGPAAPAAPVNTAEALVALPAISGIINDLRLLTAPQVAQLTAGVRGIQTRVAQLAGVPIPAAPVTVNNTILALPGILAGVNALPVLAAGEAAVNVATAQGQINGMRALFGLAPVAAAPINIAGNLQTTLAAMTRIIGDATNTTINMVDALTGQRVAVPGPALAANAPLSETIAKLGNISGVIPGLRILALDETVIKTADIKSKFGDTIQRIGTLVGGAAARVVAPTSVAGVEAALKTVAGALPALVARIPGPDVDQHITDIMNLVGLKPLPVIDIAVDLELIKTSVSQLPTLYSRIGALEHLIGVVDSHPSSIPTADESLRLMQKSLLDDTEKLPQNLMEIDQLMRGPAAAVETTNIHGMVAVVGAIRETAKYIPTLAGDLRVLKENLLGPNLSLKHEIKKKIDPMPLPPAYLEAEQLFLFNVNKELSKK